MRTTLSKMLVKLAFVAAASATAPASAALIAVDAGFGPGSGTLDTASNLTFLDVNLSTGLSYNQVQAQLGPSGAFSGFRYATVAEVVTLFNNSGALALNPMTDEAAFFGIVSLLGIPAVDLFGTGDVLAYRGVTANQVFVMGASSRTIAELVIDRFTINPMMSAIFSSTAAFLRDDVAAAPSVIPPAGAGVRSSGGWLVRINAVPAPSTVLLMLVGLMALAVRFAGKPMGRKNSAA